MNHEESPAFEWRRWCVQTGVVDRRLRWNINEWNLLQLVAQYPELIDVIESSNRYWIFNLRQMQTSEQLEIVNALIVPVIVLNNHAHAWPTFFLNHPLSSSCHSTSCFYQIFQSDFSISNWPFVACCLLLCGGHVENVLNVDPVHSTSHVQRRTKTTWGMFQRWLLPVV